MPSLWTVFKKRVTRIKSNYCQTFKRFPKQLTLDGEDDPFADGRRDTVAGDAEVGPHLGPGDSDQVKDFPLKTLLLCKKDMHERTNNESL